MTPEDVAQRIRCGMRASPNDKFFEHLREAIALSFEAADEMDDFNRTANMMAMLEAIDEGRVQIVSLG